MANGSGGQSGDAPRALVVQHLAPEHAGAIGEALQSEGIALDVRRMDLGHQLPADLADHVAVVIMGGPMSAYSDDGFPTRLAEIEIASRAVASAVPFLGVCLGAQILAIAAGGACFSGAGPETGWEPIVPSPEASADPIFNELGGGPLDVFHWHSDTFSLPRGAVRLASSRQYANQAFRVGDRAWGIQCHPEVDAGIIDGILAEFGSDLTRERRGEIQSKGAAELAALRPAQVRMFAAFATLARAYRDRQSPR